MLQAFQTEIVNILVLVITGCIGVATKSLMSYLKKKGIMAKISGHKELANIVVNAVEQTYNHLHGEEKLNLAKIELIKIANEKGLKISEKELDLLIESSVKAMNQAVKESK